jgi:hypothetical protein
VMMNSRDTMITGCSSCRTPALDLSRFQGQAIGLTLSCFCFRGACWRFWPL